MQGMSPQLSSESDQSRIAVLPDLTTGEDGHAMSLRYQGKLAL